MFHSLYVYQLVTCIDVFMFVDISILVAVSGTEVRVVVLGDKAVFHLGGAFCVGNLHISSGLSPTVGEG